MQFVKQHRVVNDANLCALEGQRQCFDGVGFAGVGGLKATHRQPVALELLYQRLTHRIAFGDDGQRVEAFGQCAQPPRLHGVINLVEAIHVDQVLRRQVNDCQHGEIIVFAPVHTDGVFVEGVGLVVALRPIDGLHGGCIAHATENAAAVLNKLCKELLAECPLRQ